jgi:hypothetical protein
MKMKSLIIKKLIETISRKGLLAGSLLGIFMSPSTFAASGSTQVDITFPPLVILYYYDNIDITVDADDLSAMLANGVASCSAGSAGGVAELDCAAATDPRALGTAAISGTEASYDASIEGDANVNLLSANTDLTFVIENSWAVRALGGTLAATIGVTGTGDFTSPLITPAVPTSSLTLTDGDNIGDVQFDVDITGITGLLASDTLTITVTSTP